MGPKNKPVQAYMWTAGFWCLTASCFMSIIRSVSFCSNCLPHVSLDRLVFRSVEQQACNWRMNPLPERLYSSLYCAQVASKSSQASNVESVSRNGRGNFSGLFLSTFGGLLPPSCVIFMCILSRSIACSYSSSKVLKLHTSAPVTQGRLTGAVVF